MRILLLGDTHGSRSAISFAFELASTHSCDRLFQLGDFGFWPKSEDGNTFLEFCDKQASGSGLPLYFLAGNHEDWNDLDYVFATYRTDEDGFHKYGAMRIAPRANAWVWDGINFANMSGAFSIDRKFRTLNLDWFEQEMPREEDLNVLQEIMWEKSIGHVDVMLAHDAPVNLYENLGHPDQVFDHPLAFVAQDIANKAVMSVEPSVYVHGHWHMGHRYWHDTTYCIGLNQMTQSQGVPNNSLAILDTEKRTLSSLYNDSETIIFEIP